MKPKEQLTLAAANAQGIADCPASASMADMISGHAALECAISGLLELKEMAIQKVYDAPSKRKCKTDAQSAADHPHLELAGGCNSISFKRALPDSCSYRQIGEVLAMSRWLVSEGNLVRRKRLVCEISTGQLAQVRQIDSDIQTLRRDCDQLELRILDMAPTSTRDAVNKLHFIVGLLLDQREVEIDHFAYLVDECAAIVEENLVER